MNEEVVLTKKQVAKMLQIKPRTVGYLTTTRQMPFIKGLGREYHYFKSSVLEWVKQRENRPESAYIEP
jgi:predicted DNA-binding transcriptional regulator AlpA